MNFQDPITVSLYAPPIGTIHYTLDGTEPTPASPRYANPFVLSAKDTREEKLFYNSRTKRYDTIGNTVHVKARVFDAASKPIGELVTDKAYWHNSPDNVQGQP